MNKRAAILISAAVLVLIGSAAAAYVMRGSVRELAYEISQPALPKPVEFVPPVPAASATTPETKPAVKTETPKPASELPAEINLSVPFLLQAPKQNWVQPFEDACEEASLIMVDAYYDGRKTNFTPDEGVEAILDVVSYEDETYGYNKDTTSEDVMNTAKNFYGRKNVSIEPATEANIKAALAKGYPVIVPAHGKSLLNPNFRNGGPEYHMLVIKGYLKDGRWITNDPGTRMGHDYIYPKQRLLDAIHDFNEEDMKLGAKIMIVIKP
ncbi:C39 family peptidase [Candidatus Uhrbacteria bacterium]|nr:C39 family peptidase [Candidatus Uhrbacteria bacterium]